MNIFIPLCGIGQRFKTNGYQQPKPMIKILGKEMILYILDNLYFDIDDIVYIIYNTELVFDDIIKKYNNINFIKLNKQTTGVSETILISLDYINPNRLLRKCVILDGDTFYNIDILSIYKKQKYNAIFCFRDCSRNNIFSYIEFNNEYIISEIKEKQKISDYANTGCYCFENGNILKQYCYKIVSYDIKQKGECYISCIIDLMIKDLYIFYANIISQNDFNCVGTPLQLQLYCAENLNKCKKICICFNLENLLILFQNNNIYDNIKLVNQNINYIRFLKNNNYKIIIYANNQNIIYEVLDKYNIPYDELHFQKPKADLYINDIISNVFNIEKEIGIYNNQIQERDFNHVTSSTMEIIIKKGNMHKLSGEIYFYKNILLDINYLFPIFIKEIENGYIIEKINGITLSYIYLKECLTPELLLSFLENILIIHKSQKIRDQQINIYDNYSNKIKHRYNNYDYTKFNNSNKIFQQLIEYFDNYEKMQLGYFSIIHGDPVFSNIIITKDITFKFIDMRGKLGEICSIYGDMYYDYGKIYQSLLGYDEILLDINLDHKYKNEIIKIFEMYIINQFSEQILKNIKMITKSLLFTLIPLHDNDKCFRYYNLIKMM